MISYTVIFYGKLWNKAIFQTQEIESLHKKTHTHTHTSTKPYKRNPADM